jgi:hypothetical protein
MKSQSLAKDCPATLLNPPSEGGDKIEASNRDFISATADTYFCLLLIGFKSRFLHMQIVNNSIG